MKLERITDTADAVFNSLYSLYEASFPEKERRSREMLTRLMSEEKRMSFCAIVDNAGKVLGLLCYWDLGGFNYLEHLAVFPEMRGHGIGHELLDLVHAELDCLTVLEAEPADLDEIAARRIGFYERNGFHVADKDYIQPPYNKGGESFPLWILANRPVSAEDMKKVKDTLVREIYVSRYE